MSNRAIIEKELTQGVVPIGTPKAYQYDQALVESAKASVQQGLTDANTILTAIRNEYGYPFTASSADAMTDQTKIYVYTGTTTASLTQGHWYYYNGSVWTDGGSYNSYALETDPTLTISGAAADAKTVGEYIKDATIQRTDTSLFTLGALTYAQGVPAASTNRMTTPILEDGIGFRVASGYDYEIFAYQANGTYVGIWNGSTFITNSTYWINSPEVSVFPKVINPSYKYRVSVRKSNDADLTVSTDALNVYFIYPTDKSLSVEGIAADAKIVGAVSNKLNRFYETKTTNYVGSYGLISSDDGSVVDLPTGRRYIEIDLTDGVYDTLTFQTTTFGSNYGYGFVLSDDSWVGVHTTETKIVTVTVPTNAVTFKTCWVKDYYNYDTIDVTAVKAIVPTFDNVADYVSETSILKNRLYKNFTITRDSLPTGLISSDDGSVVANSSAKYMEIDLTDGVYDTLTFDINANSGNYGYGFVLSDNSWTGVHTTETKTITVTVPANAVTFKTCWNKNVYPGSGGTVTAFGFIETSSIKTNNIRYPFDTDFDVSFIEETDAPMPANYMSVSLSDMYALYDSLVTDFPDWVDKTDCSDADTEIGVTRPAYLTGMPIYLYHFSPSRLPYDDRGKRLKFFIVGGTHPNEKMGIFQIYNFLRMLCNRWKTEKTCGQLRTMVDFYVIPCLSPWGFVNTSRVNYNGVNLNRNFPTKNWSMSGYGTADYTGASAGSEYETKIAMYYVNAVQPDIFWDVHAGGMPASGRYGALDIDADLNEQLYMTCVAMGRDITNAWIAENSNFPDSPDQPLFAIDVIEIVGEEFRWVAENVTKGAILTELSNENNWVNGELSESVIKDTPSIWKENLQSFYNTAIRLIDYCSQIFFKYN